MGKKILSWTLIGLTLVFWGVIATKAVGNADFWFHLKTGEYIVENKTVPHNDIFSFSAQGRDWIAQWWLYDVVIHQVQARFGFNGLIGLKIINAVLIGVVLFRSLKRFRVPVWLGSILTILGVFSISNAWVDRPHLFSYFYIVLLIDLLLSYKQGNKRSLFFIPPLMLIWANTHASIPLGFVLMGFMIATVIWERLSEGADLVKSLPRYLIGTTLASGLISLINPNTYRTHLYVFKIDPEFVSGHIVEWIPLSAFLDSYHIQIFLVFACISLVSFIFVLRKTASIKPLFRPNLFEILIYLSLIYLAVSALRFAPVFILMLLPFTAKNLYATLGYFTGYRSMPGSASMGSLPEVVSIVLILIIIPVYIFRLDGISTGVRFDPFPVQAVRFLKREKPASELFHPFNWGGYLIWDLYPDYKVFVDGRLDMYVPDIYEEWLSIVKLATGWETTLKDYKVNTVLLGTDSRWNRLGQKLEESPEWILVYWDGHSTIFVRNIPANKRIIDSYALTSILLYNERLTFRPGEAEQAAAEYRSIIRECPDCVWAHNNLGVLYLLNRNYPLAKKYFSDAARIDRLYGTAIYNYGYVLELQRDYNSAIEVYEAAKKTAPYFPDIYFQLGMIYFQQLDYRDKALENLRRYLELRPESSNVDTARSVIMSIEADQDTNAPLQKPYRPIEQ